MKTPKLSTTEADEIKEFIELSSLETLLYSAGGDSIYNRRKLETFNILKLVHRDKMAFNLNAKE